MNGISRCVPGLVAAAFCCLLAQDPGPLIRVPVRLVTVPTLVFTGDGHLVHGLRTGDFRIFDNGHLQKIRLSFDTSPVSVAIAVQSNRDVREYRPFIARTGSVFDAHLVGETGESAVLAYNEEVKLLKPFDRGDCQTTLKALPAGGKQARMIDAAMRAIDLLRERPAGRARVLILVGQPMDKGSESTIADLRRSVEVEGISVYSLALPEAGKAFVSDTFSLQGPASQADRGGFSAGVELVNLMNVVSRSAQVERAADPFSLLAAATGGTQIRFRKQRELEDAISAIGVQLRSAYVLTYSPNSTEPGYHRIDIEAGVPNARIFSRPGYWLGGN
jgi:VWFA-related protein